MKPSPWLRSLIGNYPDAKYFNNEIELTNNDAKLFASLWLSEGVPFAFLEHPGVYQAARHSLAKNLAVSHRDISLTGSARLGYSLSPSKFGAAYDSENSDIDLFVVNERLYKNLHNQAFRFISDFNDEKVDPKSQRVADLWRDNVKAINTSTQNGYIDATRVPNLDSYPAIQKVNNSAYVFLENINSWSGKKIVKKCTIRTYENWTYALNYIGFNLRRALQYRVS